MNSSSRRECRVRVEHAGADARGLASRPGLRASTSSRRIVEPSTACERRRARLTSSAAAAVTNGAAKLVPVTNW